MGISNTEPATRALALVTAAAGRADRNNSKIYYYM
jgi:hypothetical protein